MGLLDDAIREHLDLKRRRGADPAEVERAEREALGPVRRNREPATAGGVAADAAPLGAPAPAYDHADEEGWAAEPGIEEWDAEPAPEGWTDDADSEDWVYDSMEDRPAATPRPVSPPPLELADDEDHVLEPKPEPEPEPKPEAPPRRRFGRLSRHSAEPAPTPLEEVGGGETVEYDVPHTVRGAEPPSDEDVLEETPEFLQDTPDHDRLWFEQRPPRDFDFDD